MALKQAMCPWLCRDLLTGWPSHLMFRPDTKPSMSSVTCVRFCMLVIYGIFPISPLLLSLD